jgi:REP element-mobilizing transposase RayT
MRLNEAGGMVQAVWAGLPAHYAAIDLDEFVVMPNHLHGVVILGADSDLSLGDIVQRFKTLTTSRFSHGVRQAAWPAFRGRLWQRNYYDHVIRDEGSLERLREYIRDNPLRWAVDPENPAVGSQGPT